MRLTYLELDDFGVLTLKYSSKQRLVRIYLRAGADSGNYPGRCLRATFLGHVLTVIAELHRSRGLELWGSRRLEKTVYWVSETISRYVRALAFEATKKNTKHPSSFINEQVRDTRFAFLDQVRACAAWLRMVRG